MFDQDIVCVKQSRILITYLVNEWQFVRFSSQAKFILLYELMENNFITIIVPFDKTVICTYTYSFNWLSRFV